MNRSHHCRLLALVTITVIHAQPPHSHFAAANMRVDSDLVLINTLVTDQRGMVIADLDTSRFRLFEDGMEQVIKFCVSEDVPVSIGLVLDTSGSMSTKLPLLKQAAVQFLRAGNPADEYYLIEFRDRPQVTLAFTTDTDELGRRIGQMQAGGATALFDAVHLAVHEMRRASNPRRAILVISDGLDNHSRYTERDTKKLLSEVGFPIYTINVYERPRSGSRYAIQRQDPGIIEAFSLHTGGRSFRVVNPKRLTSAAETIASEIRHEYILGYVPSKRELDGRFHRVRVQVGPFAGPRFRVSHRVGYYAPTQ
jgi:Ca-activated chloride channel family protein